MDQPMQGNPLDRDSIGSLVLRQGERPVQGFPPLLERYLSLEDQLQPNGFDLTLLNVDRLASAGSIGASKDQRELSSSETLAFDGGGWLQLQPGPYLITFNEIINLGLDLMALGRPRSSLLRSGVSVHTAVWDAGYRGRSQALLVVHNPCGYRVQRGARLVQLVFFRLPRPASQGYQGRFLGENL